MPRKPRPKRSPAETLSTRYEDAWPEQDPNLAALEAEVNRARVELGLDPLTTYAEKRPTREEWLAMPRAERVRVVRNQRAEDLALAEKIKKEKHRG